MSRVWTVHRHQKPKIENNLHVTSNIIFSVQFHSFFSLFFFAKTSKFGGYCRKYLIRFLLCQQSDSLFLNVNESNMNLVWYQWNWPILGVSPKPVTVLTSRIHWNPHKSNAMETDLKIWVIREFELQGLKIEEKNNWDEKVVCVIRDFELWGVWVTRVSLYILRSVLEEHCIRASFRVWIYLWMQ